MKRLSLSLLLAVGALLAFAGGSLAPPAAAQPAPDDPCAAGAVELGALDFTPLTAAGHLKGAATYPTPDDTIGRDVYRVTTVRGYLINLELNQIIKIFTVASVAFLPPTLVASIYGMNFDFMPELKWALGYPLAVAIMMASAILPFAYFKRRGWL